MQSYVTVYQGGVDEIVEKRSRFIAEVFPVETEQDAAGIIEETRKKYWDARHHCYAFVLGAGGEISRCSDDGEPPGTAGRPILEVLTGRGLKNVLVIVTRYFGGTLLGTGGLVRAYTEAAQAGIAASRVITKEAGHRITVTADYNGAGKLKHLLEQRDIGVYDTQYTEQVQMILLVPTGQCDRIVGDITEATAGQAEIQREEQEIYFSRIEREMLVFEN